MKLEDQVCSLESAKRLKELGVKQESHFYWTYPTDFAVKKLPHVYESYEPSIEHDKYAPEKWGSLTQASAFSVAELGFMMRGFAMPMWSERGWKVPGNRHRIGVHEQNEAEARAKMLIYLIENKLATF